MSNARPDESNETTEGVEKWIEPAEFDELDSVDQGFVDKLIAVNALKNYIQSNGYQVDNTVLVTINTLLLIFQNDVQLRSRYNEEVRYYGGTVEVPMKTQAQSPERFRNA